MSKGPCGIVETVPYDAFYHLAGIPSPAPSERWSDWLFLVNHVLDVGFIADMLLQFRLAYKIDDPLDGTRWVTAADPSANRHRIPDTKSRPLISPARHPR